MSDDTFMITKALRSEIDRIDSNLKKAGAEELAAEDILAAIAAICVETINSVGGYEVRLRLRGKFLTMLSYDIVNGAL